MVKLPFLGKKKAGKKERQTCVGLDLGTDSIKIVALDLEGERLTLSKFRLHSLGFQGERIPGSQLVKVLKKLFAELEPIEKRVRVSVSGRSVIVRHVEMPRMSEEELRAGIKYEADRHVPFSLDMAVFDCAVIDGALGASERRMKVLLAAAKKDVVHDRIKLAQDVGLTVELVDVDSVAMQNAYIASLGPDEHEGTVGLVNIGCRRTHINVLHNATSCFTREVDIGGAGLTLAISKGLGVEYKEAEEMKCSGDEKCKPFVETVLRSLVREVRSSLDYFEGQEGQSVSTVLLGGGSSALPGLCEHLQEKLGIAVALWNPFARIETPLPSADVEFLTQNAQAFSVAAGLAVRRIAR